MTLTILLISGNSSNCRVPPSLTGKTAQFMRRDRVAEIMARDDGQGEKVGRRGREEETSDPIETAAEMKMSETGEPLHR